MTDNKTPKPGDSIAVWFSRGAASATAAIETIKQYGDMCDIRILNNPVIEEHEDNQRFLADIEKLLGVKIESVINSDWPSCSAVDVWDKRRYMSNCNGEAPCTYELKKRARAEWEQNNDADWYVFGFTNEEKHREDRLKKSEIPELLPVLSNKDYSKTDCYQVINDHRIKLPEIYNLGYPNANCIGCVKATSPTYWNHVRRMHPDVFDHRAEQSKEIGARLVRVKGKRIFLHELDPHAVGRPMKNMDFECGLFCEEIK